MSIQRTETGTYQVRWRDVSGRQRSRTFKTKTRAEMYEREVRAATQAGLETGHAPLWQKMLLGLIGDRAAIDVAGFNPNGHFVYLLWGTSDDRPIYVGRSSNVLARLGGHLNDPGKRNRINRVTLVRCYSPEDAATTEAELIDFYRCEFNVLDGSGRRFHIPAASPAGA